MKAFVVGYWANLTLRERWVLGIGILFCFFFLYYGLLYSPLKSAVHRESQLLLEKRETLSWIEKIQIVQVNKHTQKAISSSKLLSVLADELNKAPFSQFPYQLQQTGVHDITLLFDNVPYNAIMNWAWSFNTNYSIVIKQLSIIRKDSPGIVKLTMIIDRR